MAIFLLLTFVAYVIGDIAIYSVGKNDTTTFLDLAKHHFKLLPVYLATNTVISYAFIMGLKDQYSPLILFALSMAIWVISLAAISMFIYRVYPNWMSAAGLLCIFIGIVTIHLSMPHPS